MDAAVAAADGGTVAGAGPALAEVAALEELERRLHCLDAKGGGREAAADAGENPTQFAKRLRELEARVAGLEAAALTSASALPALSGQMPAPEELPTPRRGAVTGKGDRFKDAAVGTTLPDTPPSPGGASSAGGLDEAGAASPDGCYAPRSHVSPRCSSDDGGATSNAVAGADAATVLPPDEPKRRVLGRFHSAPEPPSPSAVKLAGTGVCCICLEVPRECAFTPCGHRCVCRLCGIKAVQTDRRCPICRASAGRVLRIIDP